MALSDFLLLTALVVTAWSLQRYYRLQEQLLKCADGKSTGAILRSGTQELPSTDEGKVPPQTVDRKILEVGSSVWCSGSSNTDRMCRFHHLCFSQKNEEFVFLSGPQSMSSGVPGNPFDPALVDLSSIPNHNTQYFGFSHLPVAALKDVQAVSLFSGKHLLMNRFNPSNIMHVFHDDLLPLFFTMLQNGLVSTRDFRSSARLVFLDEFPAGEFMDLYRTLFQWQPILKEDLIGDFVDSGRDSLVCFEEAYVGLSNSTTWYQYGFQEPQGPIPNSLVTATKVKLFTTFVGTKMGFGGCDESDHYAVLITRKSTRLILNEMELVLQIAQSTGMRVITAGLEDFSVKNLMELISCAKVLIGMHGSLLVLSMFLPARTVLLELFPYAINPDHYTPYKTLVQLPGMGIAYRSWRNVNPDHSVAHPDASPAYGGITHLSLEEQRRILSSTEVPKHLCCSNPDWLFRIYQDTVVETASVIQSLSSGLAECEQLKTEQAALSPIFPSKVGSIRCERENGLHLSWQQPWNIEYVNMIEAKYEVWIQEMDADDYRAYILQMTEYTFSEGLEDAKVYRVWIRCLVGDSRGPFAGVTC